MYEHPEGPRPRAGDESARTHACFLRRWLAGEQGMRCQRAPKPLRTAGGQPGTDGRREPSRHRTRRSEGPRRSPPHPAASTPAPRAGPRRARRPAGTPKLRSQRRHKENSSRGPRRLTRGGGTASGMGEGPLSRHKTEAGFHFKRRRRVFPALSRGRLRPHATGPLLPHTHQDPGARPASPGTAPRRRQPRRPSAGGAAARPCRRAAPLWPSRSRALPPGRPFSLPRASRPARQAPGPGSAAALTASLRACAAHLRDPLTGRGGDEVRVRGGDGGRQGIRRRGHAAHRTWEGPQLFGPGGGPAARASCRYFCAAAGFFRPGYGLSRAERVIPLPRIAPRMAAEGTSPLPRPAGSRPFLSPSEKWEKRSKLAAPFPPGSSRGRARVVLHELGTANGISTPRVASACWGRKGRRPC